MDYKNEMHSDDDFECSNSYDNNCNNSNSGYNSNGQSNNPGGLSKAQLRKTNKPIMEKRRRARINHCLNELKSLILEAMKKDPARHTKLEKADILEMTVKHLQSVQRQQLNMAIQTDPSVIHKFKNGFVECAEEVNRYVNQLEGVETSVRQRLTSHLSNCASSLEQIGSMTNFNNGYRNQMNSNSSIFNNSLSSAVGQASMFPALPQDLNNNSNPASASSAAIQMGGVQLIPSRLPSGEFALIVPNTGNVAAAAANVGSLKTATSASAFASWTHQTSSTATATQTNDFPMNFQRLSAFSAPNLLGKSLNAPSGVQKNCNNFNTAVASSFHATTNSLHHNSTTTTSPPLSPISSVSSHGDDSSMMHSSDFGTSRAVSPPLDVSNNNFSGVFSTPPSSAETSFNISATNLQQHQVSSTSGYSSSNNSEINSSGLKRSLQESVNESNNESVEEPVAKKMALSGAQSTWRPW